MFAPGVTQVMEEFHSSSSIIRSFVVSVFVLGFAVGPLIVAPMSEIYGRRPVYIVSNFLFLIFTIACALSNSLGMLIAFRFLSGCVGSTPMTLGTASIGEMFPPDKRGGAMAVFGLGPLMGPVIGPIIGGFLAQAKGWRWTFWLLSILSGVILIIGTALLRETSTVILLENKTKTAIRETGNHGLVSALHDGLSVKEHFTRAIFRPLKMLFMTPIVLLLSTYVAIIFGYLYLFITTFPEVFQLQYGFATNITGLAYIGLGVGFLVGLVIMGTTTDPLHRKLKARNNGISKPEFRLPPLMITAPLLVTSFFWYGWSVEAKVHWIVPIIGTSFFSMGLMPAFVGSLHTSLKVLMSNILGLYQPILGRYIRNICRIGDCGDKSLTITIRSLPATGRSRTISSTGIWMGEFRVRIHCSADGSNPIALLQVRSVLENQVSGPVVMRDGRLHVDTLLKFRLDWLSSQS